MRILIATITAGGGHLQAAAALQEAWLESHPKDVVERLDLLTLFSPLHRKIYSEGYVKLIAHAPEVWGMVFNKMDNPTLIRKLARWKSALGSNSSRKFARLVKKFAPDAERADKKIWGKAFPIVPLNSRDPRPAVGENLLGAHGPHSLIDSGCDADGWLMPQFFRQWTNQAVPAAKGEARSPAGMFDGEKYPLVSLRAQDVESDGIGIRFLARHLVTLNFPNRTMYLQRQSIGPLPDPRLKTTRMEPLDNLIMAVILEDVASAQSELSKIERSDASQFATSVARKLVATLDDTPKPAPADLPPEVVEVPLGDVHPELAEVGWLKPAANRIPLNGEIESPLLDSGKIYATGLFAHAPSRYVYDLRGQWKTLRGEAGLHTAFQPYAYGIIFVIKTDGKEVFRSSVVRGSELVRYDVDLTGVKTLELIVDQAAEQNGGNWGLWLDPILSR